MRALKQKRKNPAFGGHVFSPEERLTIAADLEVQAMLISATVEEKFYVAHHIPDLLANVRRFGNMPKFIRKMVAQYREREFQSANAEKPQPTNEPTEERQHTIVCTECLHHGPPNPNEPERHSNPFCKYFP